MQNIAIFDIVIISITLLLGLKGLLRGFIKEVFGLLSIVGGIFVASRVALDVGNMIAPILALENKATIQLIGFIVTLIAIWAIIYLLGIIISKIFSISGLGIFDRVLGFLFGCAKIFLILSIIAHILYQFNSFKNLFNEKISNSIVFPVLNETGGFIMKLETKDFMPKQEKENIKQQNGVDMEDEDLKKDESLMDEFKKTIDEVKETTVKSGTQVVDSVKKTINNTVDKASEELKETTNETINNTIENKENQRLEEKGN
jgi:membrane protein required for colicin V production